MFWGNPNIASSKDTIEYTPEQIEEFIKCSNDPMYFVEKYIKIVHVDKGLIFFEPYKYQKKIFKTALENRFTIVKLPRQSGKTTIIAAFILWHLLFNENFKVAILANKEKQAREIIERIQLAFENLPIWLQQPAVEWNKGGLVLLNGSKAMAAATSSSSIRGQAFNMIYLDEFAFVPRNIQEQFMASVYPTISSGESTKVVITSTPNGMDLFYKIWVDAEHERNDYKTLSIHWSETPGRDEVWKEKQIRNTSPLQFRQEFGTEFLGSSNTLLDPETLGRLVFFPPIKEVSGVKIYEDPKPGHNYSMVVDTSRGVGLDYSAFVVTDITVIPYRVVATFKDNMIHHLTFPTLIHNVATYFNTALITVEINDNGQQTVDILHDELEYDNLSISRVSGRAGTELGSSDSSVGQTRKGLRTTQSVKRIGCANLKTLVETDKLFIPDYDIINELSTFVLSGTSYEADDGYNDDLVMCLVLFSWMANQKYFKELTDNDVRKKILQDNERHYEDKLTPFGIISINGGTEVYSLENWEEVDDPFYRGIF